MGTTMRIDRRHGDILDPDLLLEKRGFLPHSIIFDFQADTAVEAVDRLTAGVSRSELGQRDHVQHCRANMAGPRLGKGDAGCFLGGHRVLGDLSSSTRKEHDNINQTNVFRKFRTRAKIAGPAQHSVKCSR